MTSAFRMRAVNTAPPSQVDACRQALAILADPDLYIEIRALPSASSIVANGDDLDTLCFFINELSDYRGVYFTLNPVACALDRCAKKDDIAKRRWLLVDIDRVKGEDDKALSSTEAEKHKCRAVATNICNTMAGKGWPIPITIDSGNGYHLLYRIDLPCDELTDATIRAVTYRLAEQFSTPEVEVDKQVHNRARISKLPGTWVRKGENLPDRPHRMSSIVYAPSPPTILTFDQLHAYISPTAKVAAAKIPEPEIKRSNDPPTELEEFIDNAFSGRATSVPNTPIMDRARAYLKKIPGAVSGQQGHTSTFVAALKVIRGFDLNDDEAYVVLSEWNDTCDPPWTERELRHKIADAQKGSGERGNLLNDRHERNGQHSSNQGHGQRKQEKKPSWQAIIDDNPPIPINPEDLPDAEKTDTIRTIQLYTMAGLVKKEFPEPSWVVPGILSEGLNILGGKPKQGKSMMALNLGLTIAAGGHALKKIRTVPGDVLYLSLEDKYRRVKSRAAMMLKGLDVAVSSRLSIAVEWPKQDADGLKLIEWWARRCERPTLVIIDVWGRFKQSYRSGSQYEQDYEQMTEVKKTVDGLGISALVLHHCRKQASETEDVLEELSGTMGLSGSADGIIVLTRSRNDNEAKIFATGRDIKDVELALRFNPDQLTWESLGPADEHIQGKLQAAIINYLRGLGGQPAFVTDIANSLNEDAGSVRTTMYKLQNKKMVRKVGKAWAYPGDGGEPEDEGTGDVHW